MAPIRRRTVPVCHLRLLSDDLDRELGEALVRLGPPELCDRPLGAGYAGALEAGQGAVVGVPERLQIDPLACDTVAHQRVGPRSLAGQSHELANRDIEGAAEGEAEGASFLRQGRHRNAPAPTDLTEQVLLRHRDA